MEKTSQNSGQRRERGVSLSLSLDWGDSESTRFLRSYHRVFTDRTRWTAGQIPARLTTERRHSRLIGLASRTQVAMNRYAARKWHALFIAGRLYVIGEFGGVSVSRLLNGALARDVLRNVSMRSITEPDRRVATRLRSNYTDTRNIHGIYCNFDGASPRKSSRRGSPHRHCKGHRGDVQSCTAREPHCSQFLLCSHNFALFRFLDPGRDVSGSPRTHCTNSGTLRPLRSLPSLKFYDVQIRSDSARLRRDTSCFRVSERRILE